MQFAYSPPSYIFFLLATGTPTPLSPPTAQRAMATEATRTKTGAAVAHMDYREALVFLFTNAEAARVAVMLAAILTPLIVLVLKPLWRRLRQRRPQRPLYFVPSTPTPRASRSPRSSTSSTTTTETTKVRATSSITTSVRRLGAKMNPITLLRRLGCGICRRGGAVWTAVWRRRKQQPTSAPTSSKKEVSPKRSPSTSAKKTTTKAATATSSTTRRFCPLSCLAAIFGRVRGCFSRTRTARASYAARSTTDASVKALVQSPRFASWYSANRCSLLGEVRLRRAAMCWRSVGSLVTLLVGMIALPLHSFSNDATATLWGPRPAGVAARDATLSQLLCERMNYLQQPSRPVLVSGLTPSMHQLLGLAECGLIWLAVVALLCSTFMPRAVASTATVGVASLLVLLWEAHQAPEATKDIYCGSGFALVVGIVFVSVVRSIQQRRQ